ncbi:MAG: hypothetical protein ACR2NN_22090 [Bryobacteraceae bacterium]
MTNEQMYILIRVPSTLALVGILVNAVLVSHISAALNGRIASVETRMSSLETRMLNLENTFTTRFDLLMGRLIELEKEIHNR